MHHITQVLWSTKLHAIPFYVSMKNAMIISYFTHEVMVIMTNFEFISVVLLKMEM